METQKPANTPPDDSTAQEPIETPADEGVEETSDYDVLMQEVEALRAQLAQRTDQLARSMADFDNYRKRTRAEMEDIRRVALEGFIRTLLPVIDNFERALSAASDADSESLRSGVEMIHRQLMGVLRDAGVEPLESVGQTFDPNCHEAIASVPSDETPEGIILAEVERGYRFGDRVVRPARVSVSSGPPP